jgi:hypothetical protein
MRSPAEVPSKARSFVDSALIRLARAGIHKFCSFAISISMMCPPALLFDSPKSVLSNGTRCGVKDGGSSQRRDLLSRSFQAVFLTSRSSDVRGENYLLNTAAAVCAISTSLISAPLTAIVPTISPSEKKRETVGDRDK